MVNCVTYRKRIINNGTFILHSVYIFVTRAKNTTVSLNLSGIVTYVLAVLQVQIQPVIYENTVHSHKWNQLSSY